VVVPENWVQRNGLSFLQREENGGWLYLKVGKSASADASSVVSCRDSGLRIFWGYDVRGCVCGGVNTGAALSVLWGNTAPARWNNEAFKKRANHEAILENESKNTLIITLKKRLFFFFRELMKTFYKRKYLKAFSCLIIPFKICNIFQIETNLQSIPIIHDMLHSIVDILPLLPQKLLAKYLLKSISFLSHESPAKILQNNISETAFKGKIRQQHNIQANLFWPSFSPFSPSHLGYFFPLHAYGRCPHNSLWPSPIAIIGQTEQEKPVESSILYKIKLWEGRSMLHSVNDIYFSE